eukprot:gb/GECG01005246.1/.p1 GENE.gb/GECG01005246.1/~~gb/GECG01005246.1/.p1  ORF type:complete len:265 (+),score=14.80 gb/GECG01005246.1/:1-795(+)
MYPVGIARIMNLTVKFSCTMGNLFEDSLNPVRFIGDIARLASFIILIARLRSTGNANGISRKTQVLFLLGSVCRYWDLILAYSNQSTYLVLFKLTYLTASVYIVYLLTLVEPYKETFAKASDQRTDMRLPVLVCAILASATANTASTVPTSLEDVFEVSWTFSLYLEAIAIFPQSNALTRDGQIENVTLVYVSSLATYRVCYLINWVLRYATEISSRSQFPWVTGIVQTVSYLHFFHSYKKRYDFYNRAEELHSVPQTAGESSV